MCLVKSESKWAKEFEEKLKKDKSVICYKNFVPVHGSLRGQYRNGFIVRKPGWVVSDRKSKAFNRTERSMVNKGIHVFLSKHGANNHTVSSRGVVRLVPVHCYFKDFVAVGTFGNLTRSAVFMKVKITPEAFKKAVR